MYLLQLLQLFVHLSIHRIGPDQAIMFCVLMLHVGHIILLFELFGMCCCSCLSICPSIGLDRIRQSCFVCAFTSFDLPLSPFSFCMWVCRHFDSSSFVLPLSFKRMFKNVLVDVVCWPHHFVVWTVWSIGWCFGLDRIRHACFVCVFTFFILCVSLQFWFISRVHRISRVQKL